MSVFPLEEIKQAIINHRKEHNDVYNLIQYIGINPYKCRLYQHGSTLELDGELPIEIYLNEHIDINSFILVDEDKRSTKWNKEILNRYINRIKKPKENKMKYFVYDIDNGIEFFDNKEKAKKLALECLEMERDQSGDGWNEEVDQICWGKVIEKVEQTECKKAPEGYEFNEIWNFGLLPVDDSSQKDEKIIEKERLEREEAELEEEALSEEERKLIKKAANMCPNCGYILEQG